MSSLFCCVDCGGTKAAAVIADANANILARGVGGPANFKDVERPVFLNSVKTAVENALDAIDYDALPADLKQTLMRAVASPLRSPKNRTQSASSPSSTSHHSRQRSFLGATLPSWLRRSAAPSPQRRQPSSQLQVTVNDDTQTPQSRPRISLPTRDPLFAAIWAGCAGVDGPQDIADLTPLLSELFSIPSPTSPPWRARAEKFQSQPGPSSIPYLIIDNDTALLASPFHRHTPLISSAVVAIAGTGCIVVSFKESHDGELERLGRAGGWGWLLGDEGSGFYIGREALRRILDGAERENAAGVNSSSGSGAPPATLPSAPLDKSLRAIAPASPPAMHPTSDLETIVADEGSSPSSSLSSTSVFSWPTSSARTIPPTTSSVTSTSSFPHPPVPAELAPNSTPLISRRPPNLQERIFAHYGITRPADIFAVVYAPDPPFYAPSGSTPKTAGSTPSSSSSSSTVFAAPASEPSVVDTTSHRPSSSDRLSPTLRAFQVAPSPTPRPSPKRRLPTPPKRRWSSSSAPASPSALRPGYANIDRKARMAALTPIVFHSAFVDGDDLALDILETASGAVARLISRILTPPPLSPTQLHSQSRESETESGKTSTVEQFDAPVASNSVLCLGGSLVGVPAYRALILKHLERMGHVFPYVEYVPDAAQAGALRLAAMHGAGAAASQARSAANLGAKDTAS